MKDSSRVFGAEEAVLLLMEVPDPVCFFATG